MLSIDLGAIFLSFSLKDVLAPLSADDHPDRLFLQENAVHINVHWLATRLWNADITGVPNSRQCVLRPPPMQIEGYECNGVVITVVNTGVVNVIGNRTLSGLLHVSRWAKELLVQTINTTSPPESSTVEAYNGLLSRVHGEGGLMERNGRGIAMNPMDVADATIASLHSNLSLDETQFFALRETVLGEGMSSRSRKDPYLPVTGEGIFQWAQNYLAECTGTIKETEVAGDTRKQFLLHCKRSAQLYLSSFSVRRLPRRDGLQLKLKWKCYGEEPNGNGAWLHTPSVIQFPSALPTNFVMPSADAFFAQSELPPSKTTGSASGSRKRERTNYTEEDVSVILYPSCKSQVVSKSVSSVEQIADCILVPLIILNALV
ncbi:hypothetical protein ADEAN_000754000 [Angomonas deanei]|uniref:Uncharacterized protein n=1 Tax=Angomonas deanei TaxID=59799 RepID=A0A7G2CJQ5_9TRYP|nr:hypothetical protein ADEAN_000754000 [Angomonas deanei]